VQTLFRPLVIQSVDETEPLKGMDARDLRNEHTVFREQRSDTSRLFLTPSLTRVRPDNFQLHNVSRSFCSKTGQNASQIIAF
jgi:hypothetical protein